MDTVAVTPKQKKVYTMLAEGCTVTQIANKLESSHGTISNILRELEYNGLIEVNRDSTRFKYKAVLKNVELVKKRDSKCVYKSRNNNPLEKKRVLTLEEKLLDTSMIPDETISYIKNHYQKYKKNRTALAQKVGIPKIKLNEILYVNGWSC